MTTTPEEKTSAPARRTSRLAPGLVLAIMFMLGIGAGLGAAPLLRPPPRPGLPPGMERLSLSRDQEQKIRAIMEKHAPEVDAALGDALPRIRVVQERVAGEIDKVLEPDQRARFREQRRTNGAPPPP